ncbi:MAG TPA: aldose 1-epimerase, partial [Variovorax sp.]|nr:aldose 1-epimerase [Variovorax sp.]
MTTPSSPVELHAGELQLALRPDLGASIAGFWRAGLPVLRSGDAAVLDKPNAGAGFAMAPYSNRLGFGRFRWQGQDHTVRPNYEGSPHPMHGVAWQRPWAVIRQSDAEAELRYEHTADADWPFDFSVLQRVLLTPAALELQLVFTNTATLPQPVGLGWHPYFPKRSRSRLHIEVAERWEADVNQLPTRKVAQASIDGDVAHLAFDNCFGG